MRHRLLSGRHIDSRSCIVVFAGLVGCTKLYKNHDDFALHLTGSLSRIASQHPLLLISTMKLLSIVLLVAAFGAVSTPLPVQAKGVDNGHGVSVRDVKRCQCGQSTCWSELNGYPENADSGGRLEPHLHFQGYRRRYKSG